MELICARAEVLHPVGLARNVPLTLKCVCVCGGFAHDLENESNLKIGLADGKDSSDNQLDAQHIFHLSIYLFLAHKDPT